MRVIKGDTWSLDFGSHGLGVLRCALLRVSGYRNYDPGLKGWHCSVV